MLRSIALTRGDIRFQWKYGFYLIYLVLVILYSALLSYLPKSFRTIMCDILVYSDPAAMGMFFMGAIVLLEKSQRVLNSIAVSPVTKEQYITGKLCSIGLISLIVGLVLLLQVRQDHIIMASFGIIMSSLCFTLCGIIVGTRISSLTGYICGTIPFEIIGFILPTAYRLGFGKENLLMLIHPGCAQMKLIMGDETNILYALISTVVWNTILFVIACKNVKRMFMGVGQA